MTTGVESNRTQERRLVLRVLALWRELCGDRPFPPRSEFDPAFLGDDARFCFLVDLTSPKPVFARIGDWLVTAGAGGLLNRPVSEAPAESVLGAAVTQIDRLIQWREPVSHGGEARLSGQRFLYRNVLLPLSEDGVRIDAALGAVNGRLISTEGLVAES